MKNILFLTIIFCITQSFSCDSEDNLVPAQPAFVLDEPFILQYQEHAVCFCDEDFSITFSEFLEDSTCPPYAQCIWEGGIRVETTINLPETTIVELFRGAHLEKEYIGQIDTVGNYIINIINAEREEAERDNPEAYTIELLVTEL